MGVHKPFGVLIYNLKKKANKKKSHFRPKNVFDNLFFNGKCKKEEKKRAKKVFSFSMPNYLLKCFYWKKYQIEKYQIESYPTDLISLYGILMETDPLSDTHFKTLR